MSRPRRHRRAHAVLPTDASYTCNSCGEDIVIPIDPTGGHRQEYVEDCPVCCHPNVIHVEIDDDGNSSAWGESEQDPDE